MKLLYKPANTYQVFILSIGKTLQKHTISVFHVNSHKRICQCHVNIMITQVVLYAFNNEVHRTTNNLLPGNNMPRAEPELLTLLSRGPSSNHYVTHCLLSICGRFGGNDSIILSAY